MSNMVVRTNILAINAHRNLGQVGVKQSKASAKLSSGFRINSAADDAAGLSISESMRAQIKGMNQASRNAQDGISLIQTAEGYMSTLTDMTQRARVLLVQAANDTYSSDQRQTIRNEIDEMTDEIERIMNSATFNGQRLFRNEPLLAKDIFETPLALSDFGGTVGNTFNLGVWDTVSKDNVHLFSVAAQAPGRVTTTPTMINARITAAVDRLIGFIPNSAIPRDVQISNWINKTNGTNVPDASLRDATGKAADLILDTIRNVNLADLVHPGTAPNIAPPPAIFNGDFELQVGANSSDYLAVDVLAQIQQLNQGVFDNLWTVRTNNSLATRESIDRVNAFLDNVNDLRAVLGATQNRLEFTIDNLDISAENLSASESRIRDADMAKQMMELTQANILQQAATAMLAQANQAPQSILQLLQ